MSSRRGVRKGRVWAFGRRGPGRVLPALLVLALGYGLLTLFTPRVSRTWCNSTPKQKDDLMTLHNALLEHAMRTGSFPASLEALITPDENGDSYLTWTALPLDPWGRAYLYDPPAPGHFDPHVYTLGRDGLPGGEGEDEDLSIRSILGDLNL